MRCKSLICLAWLNRESDISTTCSLDEKLGGIAEEWSHSVSTEPNSGCCSFCLCECTQRPKCGGKLSISDNSQTTIQLSAAPTLPIRVAYFHFFFVPISHISYAVNREQMVGVCVGRGGLIELTSVPPLCPTPLCFSISCGI